MDVLKMKIDTLLRQGKYDEAENIRLQWIQSSQPDPITAVHLAAFILYGKGQYENAIATLTECIETGSDEAEICRLERVKNFIRLSRWLEALADLDHVIASNNPIVMRSFRDVAIFDKAYVLARMGKPSFHEAVSKVPSDAWNFVTDRILTRKNLVEIFEAVEKPSRTSSR